MRIGPKFVVIGSMPLGGTAWRNKILRGFCIGCIQLDVSGIGVDAEFVMFWLER
jgi:hypothetical protein